MFLKMIPTLPLKVFSSGPALEELFPPPGIGFLDVSFVVYQLPWAAIGSRKRLTALMLLKTPPQI